MSATPADVESGDAEPVHALDREHVGADGDLVALRGIAPQMVHEQARQGVGPCRRDGF
jgi:hypothetical protein